MEVEMVEPIEPMEIEDEFVEMSYKPDLDLESKIVETQLSRHSKTKDVNNAKGDNTSENNNFDCVDRNLEEEKLTLRAKRFNLDTINNNNCNQPLALKSEDLYLRFQQLANKHGNKRQTFFTGIDIFSDEEKRKKEQRAKRFGLNNNLQKEKDDLYLSLGIDEKSESFKNLRLDAVHMRGTNAMTTEDVFEYFKCYTPSAIEWINDESCNVVWLDAMTAARALKGLSTKILGLDAHKHDRQVGLKEQFENENGIHVKDINHQIPSGYWRKGVDYGLQSRSVLLRFATDSDKKTSYPDLINRNKQQSPTSKNSSHYNNIHSSQTTRNKRPWTDLDDVDQGNTYYKRMAHNKIVYNNFDDDENEDEETDDYVPYKRQPKSERSLNMKDRLGYTNSYQDWSNFEHHDSGTMSNKNSRFLSKDDLRHKISNQSRSQLNYYD